MRPPEVPLPSLALPSLLHGATDTLPVRGAPASSLGGTGRAPNIKVWCNTTESWPSPALDVLQNLNWMCWMKSRIQTHQVSQLLWCGEVQCPWNRSTVPETRSSKTKALKTQVSVVCPAAMCRWHLCLQGDKKNCEHLAQERSRSLSPLAGEILFTWLHQLLVIYCCKHWAHPVTRYGGGGQLWFLYWKLTLVLNEDNHTPMLFLVTPHSPLGPKLYGAFWQAVVSTSRPVLQQELVSGPWTAPILRRHVGQQLLFLYHLLSALLILQRC